MATHAPMARVPFAPLDNPRLQHLASAKNRQNGIAAQKSILGTKANATTSKTVLSPAKRPLEIATFDDFDGENVDPTVFSSPTKKSKGDAPVKPFTFSLTPAKSMLPPPSRLSTPIRANMSSPRAPMTAPAGRSPKRKASNVNKNRRISAPFSRIDPPFSTTSSLPFSLDAALSGTFSASKVSSAGATIAESMPKTWFFDIYEDTPDEEASTLMEHSTLTLDLSSDEESSKKVKDDRGKENVAPEGYDAPIASRTAESVDVPRQVKKTEIVRKKIFIDEMDDGERSPLSDLETDSFIPEGLDKGSHVVIQPTPEKTVVKHFFATPVPYTAGLKTSSSRKSLDNASADTKGEIVIWEDSEVAAAVVDVEESGKVQKGVVDENTMPAVDEVV